MEITDFNEEDTLKHDPAYTLIMEDLTMSDMHYSQKPFYKAFILSAHVIYPIIGLLVVFNNSLIIGAVIRYKYLRTSTNVIIVSLAFADLLVSPSLLFMRIRDYGNVTSEFPLKLMLSLLGALHITSITMSLINFMLLAIERWIAVVFPLKFRVLGTVKKTIFAVIIAWLYGATISSSVTAYYTWQKPMSFFQKPYFFINLVPRVWFIIIAQMHINGCLILSVLLYIHIYIVIRRRSNSFARTNTSTALELRSLEQTKKVTNMTALTLGAFIIAWLPYSIVSDVNPTIGISSAEGAIIFQVLVYFNLFNPFLNMFIYARKSEPFKRAFKDMLCLNKRRPNSQSEMNDSTVAKSFSVLTIQTGIQQP